MSNHTLSAKAEKAAKKAESAKAAAAAKAAKAAEAAAAAKAGEAGKTEAKVAHRVDYKHQTDPDEKQTVAKFGTDKHSKRARAMFHLFSFMFANLKREKVNSLELITQVKERIGVDMLALYPSEKFPDSPLHQGAHALCKGETNEVVRDKKTGKLVDTFARGGRQLVSKDTRVGPKSDGHYYPTEGVKYEKQNEAELHALLLNGLKETLPKSKLDLIA